ncbi:hypothetical protein DDE74_13300 [Streptomyces lydicus]|uniref:Uncharacterized protein n=1 Tax=Streptomyces lydicus TaxID=47763 RepID=A0A3Q9K1C4_9ACTN|nr:hypothetical protein DDE74_13300 [Streptomyces lydicus]
MPAETPTEMPTETSTEMPAETSTEPTETPNDPQHATVPESPPRCPPGGRRSGSSGRTEGGEPLNQDL